MKVLILEDTQLENLFFVKGENAHVSIDIAIQLEQAGRGLIQEENIVPVIEVEKPSKKK